MTYLAESFHRLMAVLSEPLGFALSLVIIAGLTYIVTGRSLVRWLIVALIHVEAGLQNGARLTGIAAREWAKQHQSEVVRVRRELGLAEEGGGE